MRRSSVALEGLGQVVQSRVAGRAVPDGRPGTRGKEVEQRTLARSEGPGTLGGARARSRGLGAGSEPQKTQDRRQGAGSGLGTTKDLGRDRTPANARVLAKRTHVRLRSGCSPELLESASPQTEPPGCAATPSQGARPSPEAFAFTSLSWSRCCAQPPADVACQSTGGMSTPGPQGGSPFQAASSKTLRV